MSAPVVRFSPTVVVRYVRYRSVCMQSRALPDADSPVGVFFFFFLIVLSTSTQLSLVDPTCSAATNKTRDYFSPTNISPLEKYITIRSAAQFVYVYTPTERIPRSDRRFRKLRLGRTMIRAKYAISCINFYRPSGISLFPLERLKRSLSRKRFKVI